MMQYTCLIVWLGKKETCQMESKCKSGYAENIEEAVFQIQPGWEDLWNNFEK